jgi:4-hydroxybenzoate polyprenyltransferase/phosphoserine phosphatase
MAKAREDLLTGDPRPRHQIESPVLCVDLDGTYLRTDTLYESLLIAIRARPGLLLHVPLWLARGRIRLKQALTARTRDLFQVSNCPRQQEVADLIETARVAGKRVELISAADHLMLEHQADLWQTFNVVIGSPEGVNLKAEAKAELLRRRHPQGFAYIGNSAADLPVWRAAQERFAVNLPEGVRRQSEREGLGIVELVRAKPLLPVLARSMRPHQWLKNLLVFVPFALALPQLGLADVERALLGFLCLCFLTSGTYLINDLLDVEADRRHPRKRNRPIANGDLPLPIAALASLALIGLALTVAFFLSWPFLFTLLAYLALTLAYSFRLKRMGLADVLVIAILFTLRIAAGMALQSQPISHWLLMFSIFFFTSLAFMKREVELNVMNRSGKQGLDGRGYEMGDRIFVMSCGVSSGMASLVVFALFISSATEQRLAAYGLPILLWGVMAVLSYWMLRMWLLTLRGLMDDDPILYAARDRTSLLIGGVVALLFVGAQVIRP